MFFNLGIFTILIRYFKKGDIGSGLQSFMNLQTRRSFPAIDKNIEHLVNLLGYFVIVLYYKPKGKKDLLSSSSFYQNAQQAYGNPLLAKGTLKHRLSRARITFKRWECGFAADRRTGRGQWVCWRE